MNILKLSCLLIGAALMQGIACAAEISGQDKALAIEAARADLYAQILRQIKGIQVSESSVVANMATEASERSAATEGFIRGLRVGDPQFVGDVCMIDGELTLQQVVENLNALNINDNGVQISRERIEQYNQLRVVRARGVGTVRATQRVVSDVPLQDDGMAEALKILKGSGQDKLGAIEAARIDALAQLARQIKGVRVSDDSTVFNMTSGGRLTDAESAALVKGAVVVSYGAMDGELATCTMQITLRQVVENIESTYSKRTVGGITTSEKLTERIEQLNPTLTRVTATGYGAIRKKHGQQVTNEVLGSVE